MMTATDEPAEESENYFVSMTDMMVGMLFIFIIMLMVFALNYRIGDDDSKRIKDCLTEVLMRNAQLSSDIDANVNRIQNDVRGQIEALELAADQRRRLLTDIRQRLVEQDIKVEIDERNGVLRLTEAAVRFEPGRSDLDVPARYNIGRIGRVLTGVVANYAACKGDGPSDACKAFQGAGLETIFVEGHTDTTGVPDAAERDRRNWLLSTERATSTYREILAGSPELRGMRNRRGEQIVSVSGYSSTRPIASGEDRAVWARNRRIDLRFVMDADTTINLRDIIALNEQVKAQIGRLASISQESIQACK
ncbi:OmpA family protein [Methylobacterium sp. WL103]|uniref:OmpA/MotB family protein n=1 Tax=Methylobacterium sp. WL103 TaxID=2603891 RepID=UPI0011C709CA|nr:OmpA family protein [Methylobacterium sp. WL103]TXN08568.1 OmpA family protein [Methylobacterium sp. WL103]